MLSIVPAVQILILWWLLACALQDLRTRTVPNWLTVPPLPAALPLAYWLGGPDRVVLTLVVFVGLYMLWQERALGAADGKIGILLAASQPGSLVLGLAVLWVMYGLLFLGLRHSEVNPRHCSLPGVVGLYLGYLTMQLWLLCR